MHQNPKQIRRRGTGARFAAFAIAMTLGASGGAAAAQPPNGPPSAPPNTARPGGTHDTVTLLTGDRVRLDHLPDGGDAVSVTPGPGRAGMSFTQQRKGAAVSVVPADALALLGRGVLDGRLFDVTGLVRAGYDDRSRSTLPLIVQSTGGPATLARGRGLDLPSIGARAVAEPKATAGEFWQSVTAGSAQARTAAPGVTRIWLDGKVAADLDRSVPRIGAPAAWQAGHTGLGVRTAVLDSGIDAGHPDLLDAVEQAADFTDNPAGPRDGNGHGTHVASIITGAGTASGGAYKGVAPDTRLLIGKVLDDAGFGTESTTIAGMQWATDQGARVVNMSFGSGPGDGRDPTSLALNNLTASTGALFVVAAGNDGRTGGKVSNPGAADAALTVGAIDRDGSLAPFSSQGPRLGDNAVKPELTAPGVGIAAARAADTELGEPLDEHYTRVDGTSMAAPHVAGAAALLAQRHPDWRADRLKAALIGTATPSSDLGVFAQGTGLVDVARAVSQNVYPSKGTVSLFAKWPFTRPVTDTVTYRNDGTAPIALDLRVDGPASIALDTTRVTVPAHGTADATLTFTPDAPGAGPFGATVLATGPGGSAVRVAVGAYAEAEMYDVTLDLRDRAGAPFESGVVHLTDLETGIGYEPSYNGGALVVRVPKGRFSADSMIRTPAGAGAASWTIAGRPEVTVARDTTLTLDARAGKPVTVALDDPSVRVDVRRLSLVQRIAGQEHGGDVMATNPDTPLYAVPTPKVTSRPYALVMREFLGNATTTYNLTLSHDGRVPPDPAFRVRTRDLAEVEVRTHGRNGTRDASMSRLSALDGSTHASGWFHDVPMPATTTEYFSAGPRLSWYGVFGVDGASETGPSTRYTAGRRTVEAWNGAVLAPANDTVRCGDLLYAAVSPFAASARGHAGTATAEPWSGQVTLLSGGQELSTSYNPSWAELGGLSEGGAKYTMRLDADRGDAATSTRVRAEWTFSSARPADEGECARHVVPLLATRVEGDFGLDDRVPAHRPAVLRIAVEGAGQNAPDVRAFTIEASFGGDLGWRRLPALPVGGGRFVAVLPPGGPGGDGFIALRTTARDAAGNTLTQTIDRAYALRSS
ncbi:S8 family serine peptidase [Embleya sp. NBC_00896]|uniref:S8 family serine peptidase n=1 Tax=Embleya sp. NBC_00896 TaxID=2975961 RepID=UPI00386CB506|nr:S8 family serine peptidase [Embleya sp. NBC_00896]